jgi:hypothetical protein
LKLLIIDKNIMLIEFDKGYDKFTGKLPPWVKGD